MPAKGLKPTGAMQLAQTKRHHGHFIAFSRVRAGLELPAASRRASCLRLREQPCPLLWWRWISRLWERVNNKPHAHACRVARQLQYRTATSHIASIISSTSWIWHSFCLWSVSLSINFCTMECKVHFFLLPNQLWHQMNINYCGKFDNLMLTFCFQNDSCLCVWKFLKKPLYFGRSAGEHPATRWWYTGFILSTADVKPVCQATLSPFRNHFFFFICFLFSFFSSWICVF